MAESKKTAGAQAPAPNAPEANPLNAVVEKLTKENEALKAELEDAGKIVADLKEQLADKGNGGLTVKVGKKKYAVVGGGFHKGKSYTKEDIAADAKIAEELINKGSQLLIEKD